ncbi:MAG: hypothetical protein ABI772_08740 [Bacteroidota bacterium]
MKTKFRISILFCFLAIKVSAQNFTDTSSHRKIIFFVSVDGGVVYNFHSKNETSAKIRHISSSNGFIGLQGGIIYTNLCITSGYYNYAYTASAEYVDDEIKTKEQIFFSDAITSYSRIPLTVGYRFSSGNKKFSFEPFLTAGIIFTSTSDISTTGGSKGLMLSSFDTITTETSLSIMRPYKSAFFTGVGCKFNYQLKKLVFSLHAEYAQCNKVWTSLNATYKRTSTTAGVYSDQNSFTSNQQSINSGISISFLF